jgi:hypothetical protein
VALEIESIDIDCQNPKLLSEFWAEAINYTAQWEGDGEDEVVLLREDGTGPIVMLVKSRDLKQGKNRMHFDLRPSDLDTEVQRLETLGAKRIDIGQGDDVPWIVMADPEGNEFCVLGPQA